MKIYSQNNFAAGLALLLLAVLSGVNAVIQWPHSVLTAVTAGGATLACTVAGLYRLRIALSATRAHQDHIEAHDERYQLVRTTASRWTLTLSAGLIAMIALALAFMAPADQVTLIIVYTLGGVLLGGTLLWAILLTVFDHRL
ncbi:hypothetical protein [Lacticaseibacillus absianus]|uniref:hypothetical protein n=1 Tax=Lacticaseibacillus absianus TaxID=2729623 RepID=UPI0015CCFB2C|nr:hypothetical protein [Lacticaseibacillus absianus]